MNWVLKAGVQKTLSVLPFGLAINDRLQNLRVNKRERARRLLEQKLERLGLLLPFLNREYGRELSNVSILEIGTGWVPTFPILFYLMGARNIVTEDHERHISFELALHTLELIESRLAEIEKMTQIPMAVLREKFGRIDNSSLDAFLQSLGVRYIAPSNTTRLDLESDSFDLVFSNGVFEHVPVEILRGGIQEFSRVLKNEGYCVSIIGLHDHYVGVDKSITSVNFLKYDDGFWKFIAQNRVSHLNRLRESEHLELLSRAGFANEVLHSDVDEASLKFVEAGSIADKYQSFDKRDLATIFSMIASKK